MSAMYEYMIRSRFWLSDWVGFWSKNNIDPKPPIGSGWFDSHMVFCIPLPQTIIYSSYMHIYIGYTIGNLLITHTICLKYRKCQLKIYYKYFIFSFLKNGVNEKHEFKMRRGKFGNCVFSRR